MNERWTGTEKAKRLARHERRAQLTDFERFKVVTLKRKLGSAVRKIRLAQRKTATKAVAAPKKK